jgi:hypothetical protein
MQAALAEIDDGQRLAADIRQRLAGRYEGRVTSAPMTARSRNFSRHGRNTLYLAHDQSGFHQK